VTTPRNGRKTPSAKPLMAQPEVGSEARIEILEARVTRLEAALEGLQDAIHRQAVLHDERLDEFGRRIDPHEIARTLSQDARKRGL
jgi:hypothetical protein